MRAMGTLLVFLFGVGAWLRAEDQPPAGVTITPAALDFGEVAANTSHAALLQISNRSGAILRISATGADCDCLTVQPSKTTITAGDTATARIELHTCDYIGVVRRSAWIDLDGSVPQRIALPVHYRVVASLYCDPDCVALGILSDAPVDTEVSVRTPGPSEYRILNVRTESESLWAEVVDDLVTQSKPGRIRVHAARPSSDGPVRAVLWLLTDDPATPELRLPVFGEALEGLSCDTREVVFDAVPYGSVQAQAVTLKCVRPAQIGGIRVSGEAIDVTDIERDADRVRLMLQTLVSAPLGLSRGHLLIEVTGRDGRTVKLPFRVRTTVLPSRVAEELSDAARVCVPPSPAAPLRSP